MTATVSILVTAVATPMAMPRKIGAWMMINAHSEIITTKPETRIVLPAVARERPTAPLIAAWSGPVWWVSSSRKRLTMNIA
ncbi:Uncharacterised protein [Mycobacteroides abscessus subsp. abscessus]|nr:Uncharacterised protein [Mycobacteroides abscessus subsp. abscessus]